MNSITSFAPFQFEGCGPMFRLSNGLQVDRAGGETRETYKVRRETSLRDSFHSPLFHCSTCNSPTEARSTCESATTSSTVLHHAPASRCPPQHPTAPTSTTIQRHLNDKQQHWLLMLVWRLTINIGAASSRRGTVCRTQR